MTEQHLFIKVDGSKFVLAFRHYNDRIQSRITRQLTHFHIIDQLLFEGLLIFWALWIFHGYFCCSFFMLSTIASTSAMALL